jgi:pilus assembly protein CpaF
VIPPLVDRVRRRLADESAGVVPDSARVAAAVREEGVVLGDEALLALVASLRDEIRGLGPLQPLLLDPDLTDILVNAPDGVWVDRGSGLERTDIRFADGAAIARLAQRLAATAGRRLDEASPFVDARLADGVRLHAVLPPIASDGPLISLRIPHRRGFDLAAMVSAGTLDEHGARWMRAIIAARLAFLISGGTGSGKTTLLSTLLETVDSSQRILLVEDSAELRPRHPHVVRLEARPRNVEGSGEVALRDLVRQALRMRPDRLVVGEVRGAEVVDLLAAMNTGHEGGCGTVHANSPADVPARLEALGLTAGLPRDAVHALMGAGVQAVIHLSRAPRRVMAVGVLQMERGTAVMCPALSLRDGRLAEDSHIDVLAGRIRAGGVEPPR